MAKKIPFLQMNNCRYDDDDGDDDDDDDDDDYDNDDDDNDNDDDDDTNMFARRPYFILLKSKVRERDRVKRISGM